MSLMASTNEQKTELWLKSYYTIVYIRIIMHMLVDEIIRELLGYLLTFNQAN